MAMSVHFYLFEFSVLVGIVPSVWAADVEVNQKMYNDVKSK